MQKAAPYHAAFKVLAGDTPLHVAAKVGYADILKKLMTHNSVVAHSRSFSNLTDGLENIISRHSITRLAAGVKSSLDFKIRSITGKLFVILFFYFIGHLIDMSDTKTTDETQASEPDTQPEFTKPPLPLKKLVRTNEDETQTDASDVDETEDKTSVFHAHDYAFKSAMSDLRVARDFLEHHLPVVVREKLDLSTLQLHSTTFIDPELHLLMSDMLYSAKVKDQEKRAFLYLAVDHQSASDSLMAFRMLKYTCRIIDQYLKEDPNTVLPVVIPLVVYNGKGQYPYSCSLFDLFGEHKAFAERFMFTQFELVDLSQIPDEEIRQHQWSGFLEILFKHVAARDIMIYLEQIAETVDSLVAAKADHYLLSMIKYVIEKSEIPDRNAFYHWVHTHLSTPLKDTTMTFAEQLRREGMQQGIQQGMQQGMQKGIQQGMQKGKLEGEQIMLMKLLQRRFPAGAPTYQNRIQSACTEDLLEWGERILDAKNIEDVFEK